MKHRRILSLLLTLCLLLALVPAAMAEEAPEEYRITMYVESTNVASSEDTVIGQIIKDKFNIVFDFEVMTQDWNEFINLKLASQDFPEIAYLRWDYTGSNWVNGGGAIELDELMADKENFNYLNAARLPLWRMDDPTGERRLIKWTTAGGLSEAMGPRNDVLVRCDVLEAMGYPKIRSCSDYVDFLKKALEMFPTDNDGNKTVGMCVPLAESWGQAMVSILPEKGGHSGAVLVPVMYNADTDRFDDTFKIPATKENYEFFNTLYREGLLDPEVFTTTCTEIQEKMNAANPICVFYPIWMETATNMNLVANGHGESSYIALPIQTDLQVAEGRVRHLGVWQGYGSYAYTMTPATRYPERIAELLDWAASEEGLSLLTWGIEGVHWNWVDGEKTVTDEFLKMYQDQSDEYFAQGVGIFGFLGIPDGYNPYDGAPVAFSNAASFTTGTYTDAVKKALEAYGAEREEQFWQGAYIEGDLMDITVQQSATYLDPDSVEQMISEQIQQNRTSYIADLISAPDEAAFEAKWEEFMAAHEALNPEKCEDYINARYEELKAEYEAALNG